MTTQVIYGASCKERQNAAVSLWQRSNYSSFPDSKVLILQHFLQVLQCLPLHPRQHSLRSCSMDLQLSLSSMILLQVRDIVNPLPEVPQHLTRRGNKEQWKKKIKGRQFESVPLILEHMGVCLIFRRVWGQVSAYYDVENDLQILQVFCFSVSYRNPLHYCIQQEWAED